MKFKPTDVSIKAWLLRWAIGPASLLDGIIGTITFGTVSLGFAFEVSKALAAHRISLKNSL